MEQELQRIKEVALTAIKAATNQQALQDVRVKYLGKKGEVTALLKGLGKLSPEERPKMGAFVNAVRETLEAELDKIKSSMETAAMKNYIASYPAGKQSGSGSGDIVLGFNRSNDKFQLQLNLEQL